MAGEVTGSRCVGPSVRVNGATFGGATCIIAGPNPAYIYIYIYIEEKTYFSFPAL